jgi:uncharacterized protein YcfJ
MNSHSVCLQKFSLKEAWYGCNAGGTRRKEENCMNKTIVVSVASLFAAGVTFAAYQNGNFGPQYAEVISAKPITVTESIYGEVVNVDPITKTVGDSREICEDRLVERRRPERFGNKDGAIAGVVVGGLLGNQVGGGNGKKLATLAGAVGGGFAGREIDRRHVGGQKYTETQRVCRNEDTRREKTVGYNVQYRAEDGQVQTKRMDKKPGERIWLGEKDVVTGYDVAWRYRENTGTVRMVNMPGEQLPVQDGVVMVAAQDVQTTQR